MPKNGRRGLGKYVDIMGWGLCKKEGGGVFEWDESGTRERGVDTPMYTMQYIFSRWEFYANLKIISGPGCGQKIPTFDWCLKMKMNRFTCERVSFKPAP